jgi:hypothetical protein
MKLLRRSVQNLCAAARAWQASQRLALFGLLLLMLLCSFPRQATAIFGIGDVVFDPTAVEQLIAEVGQAVRIYNQAVTTYNLLQSELRMISNRSTWLALATSLRNTVVQDIHGEANLMGAVVNGAGGNAQQAWQNATARFRDIAFLAGETPGDSVHLSSAASIEMTDGFAQDALANLGDFRRLQPQVNSAISSLEQREQSLSDADNTPVAQQNITNAALLQLIRLHQSDAALHAATLEQLTVANTWQRNAAVEASNTYGAAIVSRQAAPSDFAGAGNTVRDFVAQ